MIRQFIGFGEAAAILGSDHGGLRQAFELGLARELPAYAYAGVAPFMAMVEEVEVKVTASDIHKGTSAAVDIPGLGTLSYLDLWDSNVLGDEIGTVTPCDMMQSRPGQFMVALRGYFRVHPFFLKRAAQTRRMGMLSVSTASWWTADHPMPRGKNGPLVSMLIVPTSDEGYLDIPGLNDLQFRIADVEALKVLRSSAPASEENKPLDTRVRTTLLAIIGALADAANIDLTQHNKAGEAVAAMLQAKGVKLSGRAIGEHLKTVREALESRKA